MLGMPRKVDTCVALRLFQLLQLWLPANVHEGQCIAHEQSCPRNCTEIAVWMLLPFNLTQLEATHHDVAGATVL